MVDDCFLWRLPFRNHWRWVRSHGPASNLKWHAHPLPSSTYRTLSPLSIRHHIPHLQSFMISPMPLLISSLQFCVVLPWWWPLVLFLCALMQLRHPMSATPLAMGFINSDSEAPPLFGWRATSRKREFRVELSPSRQCAPMFPHPRSQARSPSWLFLSLLPSLLISRPHNFPP